jgi:5-formyltetrahydrofolate cyclo-ligase
VVFVPLLAFDKKGNRVGYGKGFYDAFLSKCKPETIKIGLSFFEAEETIDDVFENDFCDAY